MSNYDHQIALEKLLKLIKSIHLSLFAIPLFLSTAVVLIDDHLTFNPIFNLNVLIVSCCSFFIFFLGNKVYKKALSNALKSTNFQNKIMTYQMAILSKFVTFEILIMVNLIAALITTNGLFLYIGIGLAIYLLLQRPTKAKAKTALRLF